MCVYVKAVFMRKLSQFITKILEHFIAHYSVDY